MVVLRSDYSPSHARESQEEDNCIMLKMVLFAAGLTGDAIERYISASMESARLYSAAFDVVLADESREGAYSRAKSATVKPLLDASHVLIDAGVTIANKIHEPVTEGHYPTIVTTVFKGFAEMEPVARIERPVLDIEEKTYEDNLVGFGA